MAENQDTMRTIVAVLAADGKIGDEELGFLERVAKGLGMPPDAAGSALDEVCEGEMTLEFPEDVVERKRLFDMLVAAARADGDVAPSEERLLELVASRLGVTGV